MGLRANAIATPVAISIREGRLRREQRLEERLVRGLEDDGAVDPPSLEPRRRLARRGEVPLCDRHLDLHAYAPVMPHIEPCTCR